MVRAKLEALDVRVFQDVEMTAGDDFHVILNRQLASAKAVLVLWTRSSIDPEGGRWVRAEAQAGFDRRVLVAGVFDGISPRQLGVPFNAVQAANLSDWIEGGAAGSHNGWRSILQALGQFLDRPLAELSKTIEKGGSDEKGEFLHKYPNDPFSNRFAAELTAMRRKEFGNLIAATKLIINERVETAHQKLDEYRSEFESRLHDMVRAGRDFESLDPQKITDSVLSPNNEFPPARLRTPPPRELVLRILFETEGLNSIAIPLRPGPFIDAQLLGARGAALGKGPLAIIEVSSRDPAKWAVRNSSRLSWWITAIDKTTELASGEARSLAVGDVIDFGGGVSGVIEMA